MRIIRLALVASVFAAAQSAYGLMYPITKIADTNSPIPGGTGDYSAFSLPTAVHYDAGGGYATFVGDGQGGFSGVYVGNSTHINTIAVTGSAAPGGGDFVSFSSPTAGREQTTFIADTSDGSQGVYEDNNLEPPLPSGLQLVTRAGYNSAAGITFGAFYSVDGGTATAVLQPSQSMSTGVIASDAGIYFFSGTQASNFTFTLEANTATTPAGASGPFSNLGTPSYNATIGGNIPYNNSTQAIGASVGGVRGIYYSSGFGAGAETFTKLVDTNSASIRQFTSFGQPSATPNEITFTARYQAAGGSAQGVFAYGDFQEAYPPSPYLQPTLLQIAGSGDLAPGSNAAHFNQFLAATDRAFLATLDNGNEGIYSWHYVINYQTITYSFALSDVIDSGDTLDGKTIASFGLSGEGGDYAGGAVFEVNFTDGSTGIYSFELPEPASLSVLILPSIFLIRSKHRLIIP